MRGTGGTTSLLALDAVVIDTETTSLDPRKARLVELAGVGIVGGRLAGEDHFRRLLRPRGESIPAAATLIHGIDDASVADAPEFAAVWPDFTGFVGRAVVIGHSVGFDLAVLKRECELAGLAWSRPRTLDTRLLAQIAAPDLAGFALEKLAVWLDVDITDRHTALGDAMTTARVFAALVPKLRDHGIRTVAEAERACHALTAVLDDQARLGWLDAVEHPARADSERTLRRLDVYAYRHRIRDVMRAPPCFVAPDTTLAEALSRMVTEKISSLYVRSAADESGVRARDAGIVTERDVLRALAREGTGALSTPVAQFMSAPLAAIPAEAFVYRAIGRMNRMKTRHLGVVDENGRLVGALSARDLLRLRAGEAITLGDELDVAGDAQALSVAWAKLPHVAESLLAEGLNGRDVAAVVSRELSALTRRAAVLAERRMRHSNEGAPPCHFAVAVLGSAGRGESLLAMDQDNAVIFAHGDPDGPEDRWFAKFGAHLADFLHEAGVPYCKGGVMAKNPLWRGSIATWRHRIEQWIQRSKPKDVLSVDIFFDLRGVYGDISLATTVWRAAFDAAGGEAAFAKLLVDAAGPPAQAFNLFGGIRTENGRINLKGVGLFSIVTAARALAIRHHVVERATAARLAGIRAPEEAGRGELDALREAQDTFLDLIAAQQVEDIAGGLPATNTVVVRALSKRNRDRLRTALEAVRHVDDLTRDLLFKE